MDNQERRIREALAISRVVGIEGGAPVNAQTEHVKESGING